MAGQSASYRTGAWQLTRSSASYRGAGPSGASARRGHPALGPIDHPDHVAASHLMTDAIFSAGPPPLSGRGRRLENRTGSATTSSTTRLRRLRRRRQRSLRHETSALACHASQFRASAADAVSTRLTSSRFTQLIESRERTARALRRRFRRGVRGQAAAAETESLRDGQGP
jgi:LmbE family N-acetylglucosaminyl deacetylase